jgi:hypothetical protein
VTQRHRPDDAQHGQRENEGHDDLQDHRAAEQGDGHTTERTSREHQKGEVQRGDLDDAEHDPQSEPESPAVVLHRGPFLPCRERS